MARALTEVIDQLIAVDKSLEASLAPIRQSVIYTAPEGMMGRWWQVADVLEKQAPAGSEHYEQLLAIFAHKDTKI